MLLLVSLLLGFALQTLRAAPVISGQVAQVTLRRDQKEDLQLYQLNVVDNVSFTCSIQSATPSTNIFQVTSRPDDRGVYWLYFIYHGAGKVTGDSYSLDITCNDGTGTSNTLQVRVDIINNSPPTLTAGNSVRETVNILTKFTPRSTLYTIGVQDPENDLVTCTASPPAGFSVSADCIIQNEINLRYLTVSPVSITVSVSDAVNPAVTARVTFNFTNMNSVPVFSNIPYTLEVPENTAAIYVITVTDDTLYTTTGSIDITWTSADKYKFSLAVSGLRATLSLGQGQTLDYESGKLQYSLTFTASDGYLTSDPATLTIVVTPVNEPPYFAGGATYYATFQEISSSKVGLGCNTKDPDAGDTVTLSLSGTNANLFSVEDLDNCQVTLKTEYDLDTATGAPATVTLLLIATDKIGLPATATLTVHIVEINDNTPQFAGPSTLTMYYGMKAADVIGGVTAVDIDSTTNGAVYYSVLTEPANAAIADNYISFLSNGSFIVRQSMDNVITTAETFQYVILATDGGTPQRSSTTTVNIVYDPFLTSTTTTVTTSTTSTTEALSTTAVTTESSLLDQPLFIGLLAGLICLSAILAAAIIFALCKYFNASKSLSPVKEAAKEEPPPQRRSSTPVRPNRVSVQVLDTPVTEGRKISRMTYLPLPAPY